MGDDHPKPSAEADAELEREIRAERKFTLAEAIGRLAGPGMMKGVSPVTRKQQAIAAIQEYLNRHLADADPARRRDGERRVRARLDRDPGRRGERLAGRRGLTPVSSTTPGAGPDRRTLRRHGAGGSRCPPSRG